MSRLLDQIRRWLRDPQGRRVLAGGMAALTLLAADFAQAAGGGHGGHDLHINWWKPDTHAPPLGWFIIHFVLFVGGLVYFTKGPLKALFQKRHDEIKNAIEQAQMAHTKASAHHAEYTDKLGRVEDEVTSLVSGAKDDGARDRDKIIDGAKEYARHLQQDTDAAVAHEEASARARLRTEVVTKVMAEAHTILTDTLSDADQQRLLEQSIKELEEAGGAIDAAWQGMSAGGAP